MGIRARISKGRQRRSFRVRNRVRRDAHGRLRLSVFRSNKHIYAQIIDDGLGKTLAAAGTLEGDLKGQLPNGYGGNKAAAALVGRLVAERAKTAGIDKVCFDRRSYKYHGRIEALAQAARESGLQF